MNMAIIVQTLSVALQRPKKLNLAIANCLMQ